MGNTQTSETGKGIQKGGQKGGGRSKMRLLGGKKGGKFEEWASIVPEGNEIEKDILSRNELDIAKVVEGGEGCKTTSSSDSNFTLALTPAAVNQDSSFGNELPNQLSFSNLSPLSERHIPYKENVSTPVENGEDFHSLFEVFQPLNVFKLNEYRARVDQEKASKLIKLGITNISQISLESDGTGFSTGVLEVTGEGNEGRDNKEPSVDKENHCNQASPPTYRRHMSVPLDVGAISEGSNLQKTPSLGRAELEARLQRPKFVPEKLDFRLYEKFEGYMLVNWYLSELGPDSPARMQLGVAELKLLASQFCTHLLAAGVLKQLPDPGVPPTNIFRK